MGLVNVTKEGSLAWLELNRPEAMNALNEEILFALQEEILGLEAVKVVVLTGAGDKAFVAGADIKAMQEMRPSEARAFSALGQGIFRLIQDAPFVSIAGINGFALGGGLELALACDLIYATPKSKFGTPEINLGLVPGFGGTQHLAQRVGSHVAMEMIVTGRMLEAQEAKERGLILDMLPGDESWKEALMKKAQEIASKGRHSLWAAKNLVRTNTQATRDVALQLERETFGILFDTPEPKEGISAFLEKRSPNF